MTPLKGLTPGPDRGPGAYVAELIGTFALVFFITAAVSLYANPDPTLFTDFGVIGLVHVFVLFFLIQALAVASGAHFNPAVTAAMVALRQIAPVDAAIYVVVQLAGAVLGGLTTKLLLKEEGSREGVDFGATAVSDRLDGDILPGMLVEALGTFFLVFVIVAVALNPGAAKDWAALTIAATLGLLVMVFAPLTGAGFNPARSFGPAMADTNFGGAPDFLLVYVLAPVIGAVVAALAYAALYVAPGKKGEEGIGPVG
ncbi:aquaporin [soil metagenome]